ncbi:MAG: hypothetical protein U0457_06110 [Candidatus Sericytochromatia bacterium]
MAKKDKDVTSKGGNSFLTIKKAEEQPVEQEKSNKVYSEEDLSSESADESSTSKTKKKTTKKAKSEEEKIEEFTEKVTKILDKVENIKNILKSLFERKSGEAIEKLKTGIVKGKLSFLKPLLPVFIVIQKINERFFKGKEEEIPEEPEEKSKEDENKEAAEPKKPVTFLELAEKNIIFTDNKKAPLYSIEQLRGKNGYVASDAVIAPMIMENIINAFREVAPKAKAIPTPETGKYAGIAMTDVMGNLGEADIISFLEYVRNFPRGYVGKNYRITESFAGWAVSGTPDD